MEIAEKFLLNYSSSNSNNENFPNSSLNMENKFFLFTHCHKQYYQLSKSFSNHKSSEFLKKIDEFLEKEQDSLKKTSNIDLTIEAIIEKAFSENNSSKSYLSSNVIIQNVSNNSDSTKRKYSFIIISNSFLYDLEYISNDICGLNLKRKIFIPCIEFFSITSDLMKLILHINSKLDVSGNFGITHENSIQIAFCLSNLIYSLSKKIPILIVIPKSNILVDKIKYIRSLEKYREVCNQYSNELFKSLGKTIPHDNNEILLKLIPISKIQSKFTEVFCDKILIVTNKKIIELDSENVDNTKINIIPFNNMKKLILSSKNHKIQFLTEDEVFYNYSTIYCKGIFELIRKYHSLECLSELEVSIN